VDTQFRGDLIRPSPWNYYDFGAPWFEMPIDAQFVGFGGYDPVNVIRKMSTEHFCERQRS